MRREYLRKLKKTAENHGLRKLARKTALSRQSLYNLFQRHDFKMSTLESVAEKLGYNLVVNLEPNEDVDKTMLYSSLRNLGAPFYEKSPANLSPEDTVLKALKCSSTDARVTDVLPYVLSTNSETLDFYLLLNNLKTKEERQLLGYFVELANKLNPSVTLLSVLKLLYRNDFSELSLLTQKKLGKFTLELLKNVSNLSAKKWHVLTLSAENDLLERYKKWQRLNTQDNSL